VRDFKGIAKHYLEGKFIIHLLPLVPLHAIYNENLKKDPMSSLFYLIKFIRIKRGLHFLDVHALMYHINAAHKAYYTNGYFSNFHNTVQKDNKMDEIMTI